MQIQRIIQQLGYSKNQATLYVTTLKMGESTVVDISKQVAIPRTTVQELLEDMHKRGLVSYYLKRGKRYWLAEDPDKLLISLDQQRETLQTILPTLRAMRKTHTTKSDVRCYFGAQEIKNIFKDIIESKHNIQAIIAWDDAIKLFNRSWYNEFIEPCFNHFLKLQVVVPKTELTERLQKRDDKELRQTRFLTNHQSLGNTAQLIYGNKVATITFNEKDPFGTIIEDQGFQTTTTLFFETLWMQTEKIL